jgi:hypothetical protein
MSLLAKRSSGVKLGAQIYLVYGPEKTGKSTFASQFPQPIFFDIEGGTGNLDVERLGPTEITDYSTLLTELAAAAKRDGDYKQFKTVVIDSVTALDKFMAKHICKETNKKSLDDIPYGGGFKRMEEIAGEFNVKLRDLKAAGFDVVIIGHTKIKAFTDPLLNASYDRMVLQAPEQLSSQLKSAADNIFFVRAEIETFKDRNDKTRATSTGESIMFTEFTAAFDAGNRLNLPSQMPLSYTAVSKAVSEYQPKATLVRKEIDGILARADAGTLDGARKAMLEAGNDVTQLIRIKNKLATMVKPQVGA